MKKLISLAVALLLAVSLFAPTALVPEVSLKPDSPLGALILSCGLSQVSVSTYSLWASSTSPTTDDIFLSVTLERYINGAWTTFAYTSVTVTGTSAYANKNVTIASGYQYRVTAYTRGNNSSATAPYKYYSF